MLTRLVLAVATNVRRSGIVTRLASLPAEEISECRTRFLLLLFLAIPEFGEGTEGEFPGLAVRIDGLADPIYGSLDCTVILVCTVTTNSFL